MPAGGRGSSPAGRGAAAPARTRRSRDRRGARSRPCRRGPAACTAARRRSLPLRSPVGSRLARDRMPARARPAVGRAFRGRPGGSGRRRRDRRANGLGHRRDRALRVWVTVLPRRVWVAVLTGGVWVAVPLRVSVAVSVPGPTVAVGCSERHPDAAEQRDRRKQEGDPEATGWLLLQDLWTCSQGPHRPVPVRWCFPAANATPAARGRSSRWTFVVCQP
jgi:hypothetical protein